MTTSDATNRVRFVENLGFRVHASILVRVSLVGEDDRLLAELTSTSVPV